MLEQISVISTVKKSQEKKILFFHNLQGITVFCTALGVKRNYCNFKHLFTSYITVVFSLGPITIPGHFIR